jgi:hypothetical protein
MQRPFEPLQELFERDPNRVTERAQFNHVDAPRAAFALADKRLGFANAARKFNLRQARTLPCYSEGTEEDLVLR